MAIAAALAATLGPRIPQFFDELSGPSFPDALLALASLIAVALAVWVLIVAGLATLGVSSRVLARLTPPVLRGVLLAGAAGVLTIGPAQAASVDGLPLPDRPDAFAAAVRTPAPQTVTVRSGDTLWAIAARSLPQGANVAEIAAAARAWHRANREVIGPDPNLIFPTQRLTPPTGKDIP